MTKFIGPSSDEVKQLREQLCDRLGIGITEGQDLCADLVFTSRRSWQQWESEEGMVNHRSMHANVWRLINLELSQVLGTKPEPLGRGLIPKVR